MMNSESLEDKFTSGSFRKTSEDKLTYKNIIADAINWCRKTRGNMLFPSSVKGLVSIIRFDIKGYNLSSELEKIKEEIKEQKKQLILKKKKQMGRDFYGNAEQAKLKLFLSEWYWVIYFEKIIQLLANNNLLFETEKTIPYKHLGRLIYEKDGERK